MLVGQAGLLCGTIGGGAVEGQTINMSKKLLQERRSAVHEYRLHRNKVEDIGMVCGGDVTVHLQFIAADNPVWKTLAGDVLRRVALRQPGLADAGAGRRCACGAGHRRMRRRSLYPPAAHR